MADEQLQRMWIPHLRGQFELGRPILFTGAGFSLTVKNIGGEQIPSYADLQRALWKLCFPADDFDENSRLQDLYEHALLRHRKELTDLLLRSFTVDAQSVPSWYRLYAALPWQRMYTLNIDDLDAAMNSAFELTRRLAPVSATNPASISDAPNRDRLQCVHLNGTLKDVPDHVTFSVTQYADRSQSDPWYIRFTADLVTNPVIFIGTRLEEPPLWQHLVLRHGRGGRELREMRHRSYLVTPFLDKAKQALLAQYNVVWLPMSAEEFATSVLSELTSATAAGLSAVAENATFDNRRGKLQLVTELATNPGEGSEFFLGNEPIWADIQTGRAVNRDIDDQLYEIALKRLAEPAIKGVLVLSGTAGAGKSSSLKRLALRLSTDGLRVGWADRFSELSPMALRSGMKRMNPPEVLAIDDADIYGAELPRLVREVATFESLPLVILGVRSGKVDRVLTPNLLEGVSHLEESMPPLCDSDIPKLLDALAREKRLGILTSRSRDDQFSAFRDEAGRQLLVAMIKATSGKELKQKAFEELDDLQGVSQNVYAVICLASAYRFGLSREEILVASRDTSNAALNAITELVNRHIVVMNPGLLISSRHRVIADIVVDELMRRGQLAHAVEGLALLAATKVGQNIHRAARPWRMLKAFINHSFLIQSCGVQFAQNLYGDLEELLAWDYHFWLQRGSLEVQHGDIQYAEHFLTTAMSLGEDDYLVQTEWAYLLFKKALEEFSLDSPALMEEATGILNSIIAPTSDPYAYHVLGSQGLAWARRWFTDPREKEKYLRNLWNTLEDGCKRNPRATDLENLRNDIRYEYLNIAVKR